MDTSGRPYARLADLVDGQLVTLDAGFSCMSAGEARVSRDHSTGRMFFRCDCGQHFLDGQEEKGYLVGVYVHAS